MVEYEVLEDITLRVGCCVKAYDSHVIAPVPSFGGLRTLADE